MKRLFSVLVSTLVAVSFAGVVLAVEPAKDLKVTTPAAPTGEVKKDAGEVKKEATKPVKKVKKGLKKKDDVKKTEEKKPAAETVAPTVK